MSARKPRQAMMQQPTRRTVLELVFTWRRCIKKGEMG